MLAAAFAIHALRLGVWVDEQPGPGLLPLVAALLLLPLVVAAVRGPAVEDEATGFAAPPLIALPILGAYAALLPLAGFVPATLLLVVVWVRGLHGQSWGRAALLGIALIAGFGLLFSRLLGVPLPLFPDWS